MLAVVLADYEKHDLPSREQWWMEIGAILKVTSSDIAPQAEIDFVAEPAARVLVPRSQPALEGFDSQLQLAPPNPNLHDKFGQLRISRLRQHFSRVAQVEALAAQRKFLHWELCFSDVLARRGSFDLVLGNPPWVKVGWNEAGILGERNPLFAIRKISASDLATLRAEAFLHFDGLKAAWTSELEEAEGTQAFLSAVQNYPLLKGSQTNLYKCCLPLAWRLVGTRGVTALLHPEGPYDDPHGPDLREAAMSRLRAHFGFINELAASSADVHHRTKFGVNVYGPPRWLQLSTTWRTYLPQRPSTFAICMIALVPSKGSRPKRVNGILPAIEIGSSS